MNSPRIAAVFLTTVALVCVIGAVVAHDAATTLQDHGKRVTGEVLEVRSAGRSHAVVVRFNDAYGNAITAEVGNYVWDPAPRVGDHPTLLYDPKSPSGNVADVRAGPDFFSVWAFAVGGLVAAALAWPTWMGRLDWNSLR